MWVVSQWSGDFNPSHVHDGDLSGVIYLRYTTSDVSSVNNTGMTISSSTSGSDTILEITAGTGTITFS